MGSEPESAPAAGHDAGHDAVRTAEQTVSDAWIGRLLLAETETEAILGACVRARRRAAERMRAARQAGDLAAHARSRADLETADTACVQAWEDHERAESRLTRELAGSGVRAGRGTLSEICGDLADIGYTVPGQSWTYWHLGPRGRGPRPRRRQMGHGAQGLMCVS